MRTILAAIVLGAALLQGCAMFETRALPRAKVSTEAPVLQEARKAIDEAYVQLIALNRTISANIDAKAWTSSHAQAWLDKSIATREKVDLARAALRTGNPLDAENQAKLLRTALIELQRRIAANLPPE